MAEWQDYATSEEGEHTVVGDLKVLEDFESPQLGNRRDILVYLPPSYAEGDGRYPVLYIQDGQNLFDAATSFAGEWRVDETMEELSREGLEAIVVGIPNMGESRLDEYSPFQARHLGGGLGDQYLAFITQTLKPLIDDDFRTWPGRERTGIMGSSLGGLISLYAFFRHPEIFGLAGAMSPAFWFAGGAIYDAVSEAPFAPGKIYLDAGSREYGDGKGLHLWKRFRSRRYYASLRRMQRLLVKKGYRPRRDLLYVEEKGAVHNEEAWARRLPGALRYLLGDSNINGNEPL
jgi:predicted alpha/beta superfamily hydrolase